MYIKSFAFKFWIVFLTFLSGGLNTVAVLFFSIPITHHTGNCTQIAMSVSCMNWALVFKTFISLSGFFTGAFISGLLFYQREFALKKRYGLVLVVCSAFITMSSIPFLHINLRCFLLAFVSGLQNGMFIYYDDVLVRTTHLTGYLTDSAVALGTALRGNKKKLKLSGFYLISIFSFIIGGIVFSNIRQYKVFYILACMYLCSGLYYFLLRLSGIKNQ